jgi:hypothetical protein
VVVQRQGVGHMDRKRRLTIRGSTGIE